MAEFSFWEKMKTVRSELPKMKKDSQGHRSKYAKLDQIQDALWPLLFKYDLYVFHQVFDGFVVTTIKDQISEKNADQIQSSIKIPDDLSPQELGGCITYFRRYNLMCLFDLETVDDDGQRATDDYNRKHAGELPAPSNKSYPQKPNNVDKSVDKFDPNEIIRFGKYKGKNVVQAAKDEQFIKYCDWLIKGSDQKGEDPTKFVQWRDFATGQVTIDEIPF